MVKIFPCQNHEFSRDKTSSAEVTHSIISILHAKDTKLLIIKRFPPYTLRRYKLTTNSYKSLQNFHTASLITIDILCPQLSSAMSPSTIGLSRAYGFWLIDSEAFPSKHLKCWVKLETTKVINIKLRAKLSFKRVFLM